MSFFLFESFSSSVHIAATALTTLCLTAYLALSNHFVPFLPIEISKLGNYGTAYWSFSIGTFLTAAQLFFFVVQNYFSSSGWILLHGCVASFSLMALGSFSDAGQNFIHRIAAFSFFTNSIAFILHKNGFRHWTVQAMVASFIIRCVLFPFEYFAAPKSAEAKFWQQVRALFQWLTVAFLLWNFVA